MKVLYGNMIEKIKNIVELKAKFQKVMVVYDETFSNLQLLEVYESIKSLCVYNQVFYKDLNEKEIFNGYRAIVYLTSANSFIKLNFNRDEFVNVYVCSDSSYLPYFLNENKNLNKKSCYMIIEKNKLDLSMIASLNFNMFYNYFVELMNGQKGLNFIFNKGFNSNDIFDFLNNFEEEIYFVDVDLISKSEIDYKDLIFVDLILIDAFLLLISLIKSNEFEIVDFYKSIKDDEYLIDKFYKLSNDEELKKIVVLNYNYLYNFAVKIKQKLKEILTFSNIMEEEVENLIIKIKNYSKNSSNLLAYLYLYNIFNV